MSSVYSFDFYRFFCSVVYYHVLGHIFLGAYVFFVFRFCLCRGAFALMGFSLFWMVLNFTIVFVFLWASVSHVWGQTFF